jgi:sortase A
MIVEGVNPDDLKLGPGHIPGTALPGTTGNIGIAAHRDTFFRPLRRIHQSDLIIVKTRGETAKYRVVSENIVSPDDVSVLYPGKHDTLTMVTCYPFYFVGSAPKRFIVQALRVPASQETSATPRAWAALPAN